MAFVYGIVIYLGNLEYSQAEVDAKVKQRYLQKFYETTIGETDIAEVETDEGAGGIGEEEATETKEEEKVDERAQRAQGTRVEAAGPSAAERRAMRRAAARQRGQQRSSMEQAVAGTGVLAELSAGGGGGTGDAVYDVIGESGGGGVGDLEKVLGSVGGLQTASSSTRRSQLGARSSGGAGQGAVGIDNLIEGGGVGASGAVSIKKRGSFAIKVGKGSVSGKASRSTARSADAISRVMNKHLEAINNCYKKELRINPGLKGSISVRFTIAPDGKVRQVRITNSSLRNKKVESCISRVIKRWRFQKIDKKEGIATFSNKFIFSS